MSIKKMIFRLTVLLCILSIISACSSAKKSHAGDVPSDQSPQKVVITNMGKTTTYTDVPKRAVSLNQHVTEIMLALGLEKSMVGTAYLDDQILPEFQEIYSKIPVLAKKYPSKEAFLAAEPDFAYAGWSSAFTEKSLGTVQELEQAGIKTYIQESSNKTSPTLEDVYQDIRNIGRIFHVDKKANEVIHQMKQEVQQTTKKIEKIGRTQKVFVYDSGEDKAMTAANNYMTHLIKLAGGKNIFADIKKGWAHVSWEEVVEREPEVIVIVDYGDKTVQQKKDILLAKKELAAVPAIKNKRFIVLPLSAAAEGIRAPQTLKLLVKGLYPERMNE
ncbi:ABC transporter substrate-binding protein [Thermoflavimicrobium daqui]|jgi:iron complex transport system substrate-binding protein|uniref:Fe3+-hydroxamate ABC transporter substrate-binding protein n=1 Tax=Thermoflavimicrobium daqui TaxID=2137476 RepID=A0A364K4F4_9BACL|nr:ABC transporter substrate-binding protein [Thermoflavimicrobium daqui]RAL24243.1 Fe3+-hydroxamate ABC transporter substrate-binding protein [Thermoflavimicrobium daqui]